jgi:hypothetical protein
LGLLAFKGLAGLGNSGDSEERQQVLDGQETGQTRIAVTWDLLKIKLPDVKYQNAGPAENVVAL